MRDRFDGLKLLLKRYPKISTALGTAAVGAAGVYGGPVGAKMAGEFLGWIFG